MNSPTGSILSTSAEDSQSVPSPAPGPAPSPALLVPCVWGQQQRETLWHLCLQRLQRLFQERPPEAYIQVSGWHRDVPGG
ncbi:hypothetical protein FKM82_017436 [Ascaphus truei]